MVDPGILSHAWHWIEIHTGTINESGPYYGFFSGFGSDLGEVTLAASVLGVLKHHNCHSHRCWRLGRHPVVGTPYKVCRKCHPTIGNKAPTRDEIHAAHRAANA